MFALWLSGAYKDAFRAEVFDELGKNLEEAAIACENAFATDTVED